MTEAVSATNTQDTTPENGNAQPKEAKPAPVLRSCELCDVHKLPPHQYEEHMKGRKHRYNVDPSSAPRGLKRMREKGGEPPAKKRKTFLVCYNNMFASSSGEGSAVAVVRDDAVGPLGPENRPAVAAQLSQPATVFVVEDNGAEVATFFRGSEEVPFCATSALAALTTLNTVWTRTASSLTVPGAEDAKVTWSNDRATVVVPAGATTKYAGKGLQRGGLKKLQAACVGDLSVTKSVFCAAEGVVVLVVDVEGDAKEGLAAVSVDFEAMTGLTTGEDVRGVVVTACSSADERTYVYRTFHPWLGRPEDAVGDVHAILAPLWASTWDGEGPMTAVSASARGGEATVAHDADEGTVAVSGTSCLVVSGYMPRWQKKRAKKVDNEEAPAAAPAAEGDAAVPMEAA